MPRCVQILILRGGGAVLQINSNPKCQDLSKFSWGGETPDQLKSKVPRSVQIFCGGGGGLLQTNSNPKCQGLFKLCVCVGWGGVYSRPTQIRSARIFPNFLGGRGGTPDQLKSKVARSFQISFSGEGVLQTNIPEILEWGTRVFQQIMLFRQLVCNNKFIPFSAFLAVCFRLYKIFECKFMLITTVTHSFEFFLF